MKTERRHELATNDLSVWLATMIDRIRPYTQIILGVTIVAALVVAIILFMRARAERRAEAAWASYYAAAQTYDATGPEVIIDRFTAVVTQYPGTPASVWARLIIADYQLRQGVQKMFEDREEAKDLLKIAHDHYAAALEDADDGELVARALLGLAHVAETRGDLKEAESRYRQLLKEQPESIYAAEARRRVDDLQSPATREFYDWFASRDPQPPLRGEPGTPGVRPSDDLDLLDPGAFGSPSGGAATGAGQDGPLFAPTIGIDGPAGETTTPTPQASPEDASGVEPEPSTDGETPADGASNQPADETSDAAAPASP